MKKLLIIASVMCGLMTANAFAASGQIAVVDLQQVNQQSAKIKAMRETIKKELQPQADRLDKDKKAIQTAMQAFKRDLPTLTAKQKSAKEAALKKQQQAYFTKVQKFQKQYADVQKKNADVLRGALDKAMAAVAKQGHYSMILAKQVVPYVGDESLDVTDAVVKQLG